MALKKLPRSAGRRLCSFGKKQLRWLDLAVAHRQHFAEDNAIDRGEVVLLQASMTRAISVTPAIAGSVRLGLTGAHI